MQLIQLFDHDVEIAAKKHAELCYPEESCGFVVDGKYIAMQNKAKDKLNSFMIDPAKFAQYEVQAVIHSHPDADPVPSQADMTYQQQTAVPWGILEVHKGRDDVFSFSQIVWFGDECPKLPLVGRPFVHGVTDCYSLIRDYYQEKLGVTLLDFPRSWDWWNNTDEDLYSTGFKKTGFRTITQQELRKHDVILSSIAMRKPMANHGSIYIGDELVMHHIAASHAIDFSRVSNITPAHPYLKRAIVFLRHESQD